VGLHGGGQDATKEVVRLMALPLDVGMCGMAWLASGHACLGQSLTAKLGNMHAVIEASLSNWVLTSIGVDKHVQQAGWAAAYLAGGGEVGATHTSVQPVHSTASGHRSLSARHSLYTSRV
jgi:hypothetical protein